MKKTFILLLLVTGGLLFYRFEYLNNRNKESKNIVPTSIKKVEEKIKAEITNRSIFVPYWNVDDQLQESNYDEYIYFGITAGSDGVNRSEAGYTNLEKFVKSSTGKKTYLTLRLLDNDFNQELLKDEELQQKIIDQTLDVLNENNFEGVVLDLELFSLFNEQLSGQINDFVQKFYTSLKSDYKTFGVTVYGDVFFRKRPYDIGFIAKNCDEILVMAYDFSKARGEPGPNFPYETGPDNNYSFKRMISDFKTLVPPDKLTIIFGMYGYDWQVDEKKRPITSAKALTLLEIKKEFLENCQWEDCVVKQDAKSYETEVNYVYSTVKDDTGYMDYHIVWFEDEKSTEIKTKYIQEQGIGSVGYWAWGYF